MNPLSLELLSVNVAQPKMLGEQNGDIVYSAIGKIPVSGATVDVGRINLAGDEQADRENHGGPDKAIYCYPADHWSWWQEEHDFRCAPGAFGENLTIAGANETAVHIGDRFAWGDAVLQVAQPRVPCFKLQMYAKRTDVGALLTTSGRCGWYFRVLKQAGAPTKSALTRIGKGDGPTVREAFHAAFDRRVPHARRSEIAAVSALSEAWRKRLLAGIS